MTLALLLTAVGGAWADGKVINYEIDHESLKVGDILVEGFSISGPKSVMFYFNAGRAKKGETLLNNDVSFYRYEISSVGTNAVITLSADAGDAAGTYTPIDETGQVANAWIVTSTNGSGNSDFHLSGYKYVAPNADPDVEVTTNKAEGETTFTEASFTMPAFDATAEYELVRDMSVQMTTKVGNAADGADYRIRIKKDNQTGKFVPAEMNPQAMAGLITVTDDIEEKTLTNVTDYTVSIFAVDGDNNPTGDAIAFTDLVPGRYVAIATAADGSAYDGATKQSNVFVLFQGYEIEVPAGEFATFYKEEALGLGEEHYTAGAALYTITDVNGTTATATELEITTDEPPLAQVAPAYTPLLVYNGSDEDMRVLLIPTTSSATVSHFSGFTGSLESQTLWGGEGFYACNGKQFVYVKNDLTLPANKCCLKITSGNSFEQGSRSITIVFDETTKITNTNLTNLTNGDWYDLNGRKLNGMPTKKGVYIMNGRKVVVK